MVYAGCGAFISSHLLPIGYTSTEIGMILSSALIPLKTTRTSAGVQLVTLKKDSAVIYTGIDFAALFSEPPKLRKLKIPASPAALPDGFSIPYTD